MDDLPVRHSQEDLKAIRVAQAHVPVGVPVRVGWGRGRVASCGHAGRDDGGKKRREVTQKGRGARTGRREMPGRCHASTLALDTFTRPMSGSDYAQRLCPY